MNKQFRSHRKSSQGAWIGARARLSVVLVAMLFGALGCQKPKAMDALWSNDLVDDNAFARNPVWSRMKQSGEPPDPCAFCPCQSQDPQAWKGGANCTNQSLETNSSLEGFGHWNWFPVTYEGIVTWGGHSNSWYDDDDYYLDVKRSDRSLETAGRDGLHIEFDTEETVTYWDDTNTWWDGFHHNYVDHNDQAAHDRIDGKDVIVIGLLGLDERHTVHSELNPVYAMFVHVQNDATQDRWAFFVKNWGNEGYFGDNEEYLEPLARNRIRVRIRHPGAMAASVSDSVFVYGDDENERNLQSWTYQPVADGLLLTFSLRDPTKNVGFVGDLAITWRVTAPLTEDSGSFSSRAAPSRVKSIAEEDGDLVLKAKIDRLDPDSQKLLYAQVKNLMHHPRAEPKKGTLGTDAPTKLLKPSGSFPNYSSVVRSAASPALRARKGRNRAAVLSFLKVHGIE